MGATRRVAETETYVPTAEGQGPLLDLVAAMEARGQSVKGQPALISTDMTRHELSPQLAELFVNIVTALADGQAVTVIPTQRLLTTQEAADLLGISRPTLIKVLQRGELPFEMRGRHRRVQLLDLLAYRETLKVRRREALDTMQDQGQADGLYDLLDGLPPDEH